MIQRPQSIMLGIIILLMLASLFLPNWAKTSQDNISTAVQTAFSLSVNKAGTETSHARYHLAIGMLLVAGLAGFSISQFKNRLLQMKIGFGITLSIAITLVFLMMGANEGEALVDPKIAGTNYKTGFYLMFVALFSNIISNRLIRKDEHLVRSMDRIR